MGLLGKSHCFVGPRLTDEQLEIVADIAAIGESSSCDVDHIVHLANKLDKTSHGKFAELVGMLSPEYVTTLVPFIALLAQRAHYEHHGVFAATQKLMAGSAGSVTLTQQQIACLLAHSFLCTFPQQHNNGPTELFTFNNNGKVDFCMWAAPKYPLMVNKVRCLEVYFERVRKVEKSLVSPALAESTQGKVSFIRKHIPESEQMTAHSWRSSSKPLLPIKFCRNGSISDDVNVGCLQVDFANKYIGGGVLEGGCVQEEIYFNTFPDCLISLALCERMQANESIVIVGAEHIVAHKGYGHSFECDGEFEDHTPLSKSGVRRVALVAIDAVPFPMAAQYEEELILRELNKAYVGFCDHHEIDSLLGPHADVVTGNWGCGAFGGDVQLKSLIQWAAASLCGRRMRYYSFANQRADALPEVARACEGKSVGWLCSQLCRLGVGHVRDLSAGMNVFGEVCCAAETS